MDYDLFNVPRELTELIETYKKLLLKWNNGINLISPHTIQDFDERHVLDSLQLLKFMENKDIKLVDVGSGAGLPGMILSIAGIKSVTLVEANRKKSTFLVEAKSISTNEIKIMNERVEKLKLECDVLTARAFSSLSDLFKMVRNITVKDKLLLLKGSKYKEELRLSKEQWSFDYEIYDSITCKFGKILEIRNLCPK